jgi:hypothetical protein
LAALKDVLAAVIIEAGRPLLSIVYHAFTKLLPLLAWMSACCACSTVFKLSIAGTPLFGRNAWLLAAC